MHRVSIALALIAAVGITTSVRAQSWMPVGPPGGNVRALVADPARPNHLYLGTGSSTFYRSDDGGRRWMRSSGFPVKGCSLDEIVVGRNGAVFVGYWEINGRGGGVARSDDGGKTFSVLKGMVGESVRALAVCPADRQVIAAGTLSGVFLSGDGGQSWRRITPEGHPDLHNVESMAFNPTDPKTLYVGTWHLGWWTTDAGVSWQPMHRGMEEDSDIMTLTVDPRDPSTLYATACTGIYRAARPGEPWTTLRGIPEGQRRTRAFALDESDDNVLFAGTTTGLWISEDRGAHWRRVTPTELVINALVVRPDGTILLGTEDAGVLRSADRGETWKASNEGFSERFVTRMLFDDASSRLLIAVRGDARHGGVFASAGVRGPWTRLGEGLEGRQVLSLASLGGTLFAGTDQGIFARGPQATIWTPMPMPLNRATTNPRVTELIAQPPHGLLAVTSKGIVRTRDGRQWTQPALEIGDEIWSLAVSPMESNCILAATSAGFFRSTDGGATWKQVSPRLKGVVPHEIVFVPTDDRVLFATTSAGLYRSDDQAETWSQVSGGIPHTDLMGIAVHPDGRTMCVADFTWGGIFRSTDAGRSWKRMPVEGLASDRVWTLGFDPAAPDWLLVGASSGGLHLLVSP